MTRSTRGRGALQQFQYKKESFTSQKIHSVSGGSTPPQSSSPDNKLEDELSDSPPSQDSAYFSHSQSSRISFHKEEALTYSLEDAACVRSQGTPPSDI